MTNKEKIAEIERLLAELKTEAEEDEKENKNKRWRAKDGGDYWHVSNFNTCCLCSDLRTIGCDADNFRYDTHNYFQIKEGAEKYAEVLETERQLKKFADEHNSEICWENFNQKKWYLIYDCRDDEVCMDYVQNSKEARVIYFLSDVIAEAAIKEISEDKIIEYLKYEW